MNTEYSRQFVKEAQKLTGKYKASLQSIVVEIKNATEIKEIKNCTKLVGFENSLRIRFGDYRIILRYDNPNTVVLELLLSRGDIYKKANEINLKRKDQEY